jgi:hypothetical protein
MKMFTNEQCFQTRVFKRWLVDSRTHVLSDLFFVRKRCGFDGEMGSNGVHVVALDLQPRPQLALAQPLWFECELGGA